MRNRVIASTDLWINTTALTVKVTSPRLLAISVIQPGFFAICAHLAPKLRHDGNISQLFGPKEELLCSTLLGEGERRTSASYFFPCTGSLLKGVTLYRKNVDTS